MAKKIGNIYHKCPNCGKKGIHTVVEKGKKYKACRYCDYVYKVFRYV